MVCEEFDPKIKIDRVMISTKISEKFNIPNKGITDYLAGFDNILNVLSTDNIDDFVAYAARDLYGLIMKFKNPEFIHKFVSNNKNHSKLDLDLYKAKGVDNK